VIFSGSWRRFFSAYCHVIASQRDPEDGGSRELALVPSSPRFRCSSQAIAKPATVERRTIDKRQWRCKCCRVASDLGQEHPGAVSRDDRPMIELAYLGNAQALTLSGLQAPHHRVMDVLRDGDALKKLLLFFDGFVVVGIAPSVEEPGQLSLWPPRALHTDADGEQLFADIGHEADELTFQLFASGLLQCADPTALATGSRIDRLVEDLLDIAIAHADRPSSDRSRREFVPFELGAIGPLMGEDLIHWAVDELCALGLAEKHEYKDLIVFPGREEPGFSIGAVPVLVDRGVAEAFSTVSDQYIRVAVGGPDVVCVPIRCTTPRGTVSSGWGLAELALIEAEVAGVDVSHASFDDLVRFKNEHAATRRSYLRRLRREARQLQELPAVEASREISELRQEMRESAAVYAKSARDYFGAGPVGFALGISAAVASGIEGSPFSAAANLLQALNATRSTERGPDAYRYLFEARRRLT
jgi:hypothetical protein